MNIDKKDTLLTNGNYVSKDGGTIFGIGYVAQWDTRNYIYNPTKGFYLETKAFFSGRSMESDFSYQQ